MASVHRRGRKGIYTAAWRDAAGRLWMRTTKLTDRKQAQDWADAAERVAKMTPAQRGAEQLQRVFTEMHRKWTGAEMERITLRSYVAAWLKSRKGELSGNSYPGYEDSTNTLLASMQARGRGEVLLCEVLRKDLLAWRDERLECVSASTVAKDLKIIRSAFRQAKIDGFVTDNPCEGVKVKVRTRDKQKPSPFTEEQIRDVLAECDAEWMSMIIHSYYTSQRLADVAMMQEFNIDPVRQRVTMLTGKTGIQVIIEMPKAYLDWYLSRSSSDNPKAYIHPTCADTLIRTGRSGTLSNRFAKILERAGLRKPSTHEKAKEGRGARRQRNAYTFHGFRHSLVTHLASAGVDRSLVQDIVGHKSAAVNAEYTQFNASTKLNAMERLGDVTRKTDTTQLTFLPKLEKSESKKPKRH
jgi:integrase